MFILDKLLVLECTSNAFLKDLFPASIGLVGVVIGGMITYYSQKQDRNRQFKKEVYVRLLKQLNLLLQEAQFNGQDLEKFKKNVEKRREEINSVFAEISILAPKDLKNMADTMLNRVIDYTDIDGINKNIEKIIALIKKDLKIK